MSVINQMLKDLDKRNPETNMEQLQSVQSEQPLSTIKIVFLTTCCVLLFAFISFYIWQLNNENTILKAQQRLTDSVPEIVNKEAEAQRSLAEEKVTESSDSTTNEPFRKQNKERINSQKKIQHEDHVQSVENTDPNVNNTQREMSVISAEKTDIIPNKRVNLPPVLNTRTTIVTPKEKEVLIEDEHGHPHASSPVNHNVAAAEKPKKNRNEMSVSRRQLSANELAQQKLARAEKALMSKQILKAEKLLEDVVIITPHDSQSRKKLAALWFGRQAYQDAVNLLSQGISLDSKDSSLREMKARIHLKQGQSTAALNTLKPLANLKDEQYQLMLANTAQKAKNHSAGVKAYKMLITMQEDVGRWQLGLAVLYDKNSEFDLASKAYKAALTKNDLSVSSEQFAMQRIQAIGQ